MSDKVKKGQPTNAQIKEMLLKKMQPKTEEEKEQKERIDAGRESHKVIRGDWADIGKDILSRTNNNRERNDLLVLALSNKYGTNHQNKYAMNTLGEMYSKIKNAKPHSDEWYKAINEYDDAANIYKQVIGDNGIDYYNDQVEKQRMTPNTNEEKIEDMQKKDLSSLSPAKIGAEWRKQNRKDAEEIKKLMDTNANGKIEKSEMENFTDSLNDYMDNIKKGRDDIPVTTRR